MLWSEKLVQTAQEGHFYQRGRQMFTARGIFHTAELLRLVRSVTLCKYKHGVSGEKKK